MMIGQIAKTDDGCAYAIQDGGYYIINRIDIRTGSESPITPHEKLINRMADEILSLRTQLSEATERLNWWREMFPCVTGNTAKSYAEISEMYLKAQAEKAELLRQCAEIVMDKATLDGKGSKEKWIAKYGDVSVYQAILQLLPKTRDEG